MWQLNLMHWDLCNAITLGKGDPENIKLNAHDDLDRLWDDRIADVMTILLMNNLIQATVISY